MTAPSTAPADVAHAVGRWLGYARNIPESNAKALLYDACDLIDALAAELAAMRERAERAEADDLRAHVDAYGVPHAD